MRRRLAGALVVVMAMLLVPAAAQARMAGQLLYPPNAHPRGMSYAQWMIRDWRGVFGVSAANERLVDLGQAPCGQEDEAHEVWMLPAAGGGAWHTTSCQVPAHHPLLVFIGGFISSVAFGDGTNYRQLEAADDRSMHGATIRLRIDGKLVSGLLRYRATTPGFQLHFAKGNVTGLPEQTALSVAEGFVVMLHPLPIGTHTLDVFAAFTSSHFHAGEVLHLRVTKHID
jgi:hypothetical protein